jgi:hypothetical protein
MLEALGKILFVLALFGIVVGTMIALGRSEPKQACLSRDASNFAELCQKAGPSKIHQPFSD